MEEKKSSKIGVVILVIILMIACLCGGYFLSAKNVINFGKSDAKEYNEGSKKTETNCASEEALDVSSDEVSTLVSRITSAQGVYCGFYKFFIDKKVTPSDIEEKDISYMVFSQVIKNKGTTTDNKTFTKKEFEDAAHSLFGNKYEFKHNNIETCPRLEYDANTGIYKDVSEGCGGTCGPSNHIRVVKAIKTDNGMDIYVRIIFVGYMINKSNDYNYYGDYNGTKSIGLKTEDALRLAYEYDDLTKQGALYKISYAKEDNNYYIVSAEPVNE